MIKHKHKIEGKKFYLKLPKFFVILIGTGIILLIFSFIFFKISKEIALGDTVAGILGTCISIGAAILISISFKAQVKANKKLSTQINNESLIKLYEYYEKENKDPIELEKIKNLFDKLKKSGEYSFSNEKCSDLFYEDYSFLVNSIEKYELNYEKLEVIYKTAYKIGFGKKGSLQKYLLNSMKYNLIPYLWKSGHEKVEIFDKIPIFKIDSFDLKLSSTENFNFHKLNKEPIIILELNVVNIQNNKSKNIKYDQYIQNESAIIKNNLRRIRKGEYKLNWTINLFDKNFTYDNGLVYYN